MAFYADKKYAVWSFFPCDLCGFLEVPLGRVALKLWWICTGEVYWQQDSIVPKSCPCVIGTV